MNNDAMLWKLLYIDDDVEDIVIIPTGGEFVSPSIESLFWLLEDEDEPDLDDPSVGDVGDWLSPDLSMLLFLDDDAIVEAGTDNLLLLGVA